MSSRNKWVLVIFFPVTAYMFVGSMLLFLLYKLDQLNEKLGNYSRFPGLGYYGATEWHNANIWLTIGFPITCPILAIWILLVFLFAVVAAALRFISNVAIEVWNWTIDAIEFVWNWTIDTIEYVWDVIRNLFP